MRYLSDYHIHSTYSFDGKQTIEEIIIKAISMKLNEICLTEHISFNREDNIYNSFDFKDYENEIQILSKRYSGQINIKQGIEIGEYHLYKNDFDKYFKEHNLDFIIGSIHNLNGKGLRKNIAENGITYTYETYFKEILYFVQMGDFDILGHLDIVQRYAFKTGGVYNFEDYKDYIYDILKIIISRGKGIEVNTSGLSNNLLFPKLEILHMYKDLNGEILTVGSDAHTTNRVGEKVNYVYDILKDIGFKHIFTYNNRKIQEHSL
ncbi:histidinol-phosphatase HisJ family protein [Clostridium uliginosum]|uniref:Histidinol-phosphatase n=1 Tax=Clostridium uliginosum TaxID=119641 RepID=A0A1I1JYQ9_9CLOT|nr:histidinol-phosphatase HisJ family protein [Clostridium uliginosum]SFC51648.1 histidinol-phosphatase (PHP family) [Clostridium uliginosum]